MQQTASSTENSITQGVIWRQLLVFFFPILFGTFFQQLYNTADAVIVGRFVGKEALAAVGGSTSVLINLMVNLFVGLSAGATVVVAQYCGAQRFDEVRSAIHTGVALAFVGGAAITVVGFFAAPWALRAMGTPAEIMQDACTYIQIYFLGTIPAFLYNMGTAVLRAVGDTRRPLYFLIAACLLNIILDLLLVVVFPLGVLGVALATLLSQILSAVLVLLVLLHPAQIYRLCPREIRFTPHILRGIVRVGLPAGLQSDMYAISNIIIQSCINAFGTNTIAAWTAYGKIDGFFWMVMGAFAVSITTFVGQNFGAQKYRRIRKSVGVCLAMAVGATVCISILFCVFGSSLLHLFTTDSDVVALGMEILWLMAPFYFTYVTLEILSGAIRGTGDSLLPMIITCGGICVMRVLWIFFVLPLRPVFSTVIISYPITWAITSVLFGIYYVQGGWLRRRIRLAGYAPEEHRAKAQKKASV